MDVLDDLYLLDKEEIILLFGSIGAFIFTCSFLSNYYAIIKGNSHYIEIPIMIIFFCYINNLVFYYYSNYILHSLMSTLYSINCILSFIMLIIYCIYQYKSEKYDSILNSLIVIGITLCMKKFLKKELNYEELVKKYTSYSSYILFIAISYRLYIATKNKNYDIIDISSGIGLLCMNGVYFIYGICYKEKYFFFPNLIGFFLSLVYIIIYCILRSKYSKVKMNKDSAVFDFEIHQKNSDKKENKKKTKTKKNKNLINSN